MTTERISAREILDAGLNTRGDSEAKQAERSTLQLWTDVEDALTPRCGHSTHSSQPQFHGGEVHRLVRNTPHHACPVGEIYVCDVFWAVVVKEFTCVSCHRHWVTPADYTILAEF